MNKYSTNAIAFACLILSACQSVTEDAIHVEQASFTPEVLDNTPDIAPNGKVKDALPLDEVYTRASQTPVTDLTASKDLLSGLKKQLKLLKYQRNKSPKQVGNLTVAMDEQIQVIEQLLERGAAGDTDLLSGLDLNEIKGKDGKGNVYFTGYFTPVLKVNKKKRGPYQYPIYTRPTDWEGRLPSRAQIDGEGVLEGKDLVLAYATDPVDIYFMQVQGSGIVEYPDGTRELFAHNGSNGHPYRSIGKYMIKQGYTTSARVSIKAIKSILNDNEEWKDEVLFSNPSYIFFTPKKGMPIGAGAVPVTASHTIAVDTDYIPLGSCLLAAVPVIEKNRVIRHEYRILLAQDVGGAIKGTGHVDLYQGLGDQGRRKANQLHHYGKLWLLTPGAPELGTPLASLN